MKELAPHQISDDPTIISEPDNLSSAKTMVMSSEPKVDILELGNSVGTIIEKEQDLIGKKTTLELDIISLRQKLGLPPVPTAKDEATSLFKRLQLGRLGSSKTKEELKRAQDELEEVRQSLQLCTDYLKLSENVSNTAKLIDDIELATSYEKLAQYERDLKNDTSGKEDFNAKMYPSRKVLRQEGDHESSETRTKRAQLRFDRFNAFYGEKKVNPIEDGEDRIAAEIEFAKRTPAQREAVLVGHEFDQSHEARTLQEIYGRAPSQEKNEAMIGMIRIKAFYDNLTEEERKILPVIKFFFTGSYELQAAMQEYHSIIATNSTKSSPRIDTFLKGLSYKEREKVTEAMNEVKNIYSSASGEDKAAIQNVMQKMKDFYATATHAEKTAMNLGIDGVQRLLAGAPKEERAELELERLGWYKTGKIEASNRSNYEKAHTNWIKTKVRILEIEDAKTALAEINSKMDEIKQKLIGEKYNVMKSTQTTDAPVSEPGELA